MHLPPVVGLRAVLREEEDDLALQRVGILELVNEDVVEETLELTPRAGVAAQQVAQLDEQVQLVEDATLLLHAVVQRLHHTARARDAGAHPVVQGTEELPAPLVLEVLEEVPRGVVAVEVAPLPVVGLLADRLVDTLEGLRGAVRLRCLAKACCYVPQPSPAATCAGAWS